MKDSFKYQTALDLAEVKKYLKAIMEGLESGNLAFREHERTFTVHPRGLVEFALRVRQKNGRAKINLEMAWVENNQEYPLLSPPSDDTPSKDG